MAAKYPGRSGANVDLQERQIVPGGIAEVVAESAPGKPSGRVGIRSEVTRKPLLRLHPGIALTRSRTLVKALMGVPSGYAFGWGRKLHRK